MNIIAWIIFGALVGWIASLVMSTNHQQGAFSNILIGICGAIVGGFLSRMLGLGGVDGFDPISLLIAIAGSIAIIAVVKGIRNKK